MQIKMKERKEKEKEIMYVISIRQFLFANSY